MIFIDSRTLSTLGFKSKPSLLKEGVTFVLFKSSPEKINKIATETSAQLIKQLIGEEINNSSISAIVEDLSKKNKGKYYGN